MMHPVIANPYIQWLSRRKAWPSVRFSLGLGCVLWGLSAITSIAGYSWSPTAQTYSHRLIWQSLLGGALLTILATVAFAIYITTHERNSERPLLLKLSSITDQHLVSGYVFYALYHLRIPLLVMGGATPVITVGWAQHLTTLEAIRRCHSNVVACQAVAVSPGFWLGAALLVVSGIFTFVLLSMAYTGAAIGVWMSLLWRNPGLAAFASAGLVLGGMVPLAFFFFLYIDTALHIVLRESGLASVIVILTTTIAMGFMPQYLIGEGSLRAARHRVWANLLIKEYGTRPESRTLP